MLSAWMLSFIAGSMEGAGSALSLRDVRMDTSVATFSSTYTVGADAVLRTDQPGMFEVVSGPCTVSQGGRCVGRPNGYSQNEQCNIAVRSGGELGACPVFQTVAGDSGTACGNPASGGPYGARADTVTIGSSGASFAAGDYYGGMASWAQVATVDTCDAAVHPAGLVAPCRQGRTCTQCAGCPDQKLLPTGDTVAWMSGLDNANEMACGLLQAADVAGWEVCFAP